MFENLWTLNCKAELHRSWYTKLPIHTFILTQARTSETMSWEELAIFFTNLAYIPKIKQNYTTPEGGQKLEIWV